MTGWPKMLTPAACATPLRVVKGPSKFAAHFLDYRYRRVPSNSAVRSYNAGKECVVGFGSSAIDYLALVAKYPKPDEKLRTEELEVQGGGNCGNALTAAAKLGLKPVLLTKLGDDGIGMGALSELQQDGVDTSNVIVAKDSPSPFTYIIVDREGGTRTCIHTPAAPLTVDEITREVLDRLLEGADLVYFDGRLTEAALLVAREAKEKGIKILVEGERLRPNLDHLLELADYIITSAHFPQIVNECNEIEQEMTGKEYLGDALISLMSRFPCAERIVTTLGTRGSVALERMNPGCKVEGGSAILEDLLSEMKRNQAPVDERSQSHKQELDCISKNGTEIRRGTVQEYPCMILTHKKEHDDEEGSRAREAALAAATANAESYSPDKFLINKDRSASLNQQLAARIWVASAAQINKDSIVDTTGAGDAFIGATLYGLLKGLSISKTLELASVSAACKCTALGARAGQPTRDEFKSDLLE